MNNSNKYFIQLDGLRFFAVFAVIIAHWVQSSFSNDILLELPFVHGVILFFVLSGFLITRILLINRDINPNTNKRKLKIMRSFYIRRIIRIFPIYYLLLLFLFVINFEQTRELFPWLISYTSNIYQAITNEYIGSFNHFWSLAVEEQFYFFWPLILLFIKPSKRLAAIIITIILALLARAYLFYFVGNWMATSYFTLSCMHAIGIGALVAYFSVYSPQIIQKFNKLKYLLVIIVVYLFLWMIQFQFNLDWYKEIFDEFVFAILSAILIIKAYSGSFKAVAKWVLENRIVVYLGKISYGIYVYHLFVPNLYKYISAIFGFETTNKFVLFFVYCAICFLLAHLSWVIVEKPINSIKKHVKY